MEALIDTRTALLLALVLVFCFTAYAQEEEAPAAPVISILEKDGQGMIPPGTPPPYLGVLDQMGLRVGFPEEGQPLTWKLLKRYNMIVLTGFPTAHSRAADQDATELADLLDRYLDAGGGVLYIGQAAMDQHEHHELLNQWLKRYGAQFEWAVIEDEQHSYRQPPPVPFQRGTYLWTNNIAEDNPITRGVRTLFIPNFVFYSPVLRPIKVSKNWTVLVRTEKTAEVYDITVPPGGDVGKKIEKTRRKGAFPLIAVRQVGKGRLALFGADPGAFYYDLGKPVGAQVASVRGDATRTSDWLPLLRNMCLWLSEPARKQGSPGGADQRATFYFNPQYGSREPIDWEQPPLALSDADIAALHTQHSAWRPEDWRAQMAGRFKSFRFLVGARSVHSGGKGAVADWKKAARAAGFDGVVFREDILAMSRDEWQAFEQECKAASDETFMAVPGQQFVDWEGNRFFRFNRHIPYHRDVRLTEDKKAVKFHLHFYFDARWPANLPLLVKGNEKTPWWNYRVYSAWPVQIYQNQKLIEDNRESWERLVARLEYPTPLAVHLLDSPEEVAAAADKPHLMLLAPSMEAIRSGKKWGGRSLGTGLHNTMAAYMSSGPRIDALLALNMYRATLGDRGVPGSYRYRLFLRAHSDAPITTVEFWGGGQLLRRYRPNKKRVLMTVEELHGRARGVFVRVVDRDGREALGTSFMVHDKMMAPYWCGDHCNMLPYGQGTDEEGNPSVFGILTHIKSKFDPMGGPGGSMTEAWSYIPWGTDTSFPGLGLYGTVRLSTPDGWRPEPFVHLVPNLFFYYVNREANITRMDVRLWADRRIYTNEYYGHGYISGWGQYFESNPLENFTITHDDIDLHRDFGQPALQLGRGKITFLRDVTLAEKPQMNLMLGQLGWKQMNAGCRTADGPIATPGQLRKKLGRGNYITWSGPWSIGTIFALDEEFAVDVALDKEGKQRGRPAWGYALGKRTFSQGDALRYRVLIMRWPMGSKLEDKLDAKVSRALNLAEPDSGAQIRAAHGRVEGTQVYLDLATRNYIFRGELVKKDLGMRIPVRVAGLNPNWTAAVWHDGVELLAPIAPGGGGFAWTSLDPVADAGPIFVGNVVTCDNRWVILRLLQRSDGTFDIVAHNPTDGPLQITVQGSAGGPVAGFSQKLSLGAGAEVRMKAGGTE